MIEGLFTSAAGMEAQQTQLDAVANDLANASTPGYQAATVGFSDLLYTSGGASTGTNVATGAGAAARIVGRDTAQGTITETGRPLDVALAGPGYLQVRRPDGSTGLTRNGTLQLNAGGELTTDLGMAVLPPVRVPAGTPEAQVQIASDGTVTAAGRAVGRIAVVTVPAPDGLLADGNGVFSATAASGGTVASPGTRLRQGALEGSNVDTARAMVAMMNAQRSYALESRAIQYQDQMLQIANQLRS